MNVSQQCLQVIINALFHLSSMKTALFNASQVLKILPGIQ